ncbi:Serine/threonine-protein kinase PrkC [Roseimaritima multifibrata]|uniref:Serine/threonine-protein kinase PrkC n=1 Tax=Roseimaritima multifibrata TaxID=1930274 RepID=A0A517MKL8_9BACT|nr:serine/threonine-protein kinase [Roseimaritima multifibrata]QDS95431.1 Serine/threonine-protein kinase PrkC [Roseimaritima multifibrata]
MIACGFNCDPTRLVDLLQDRLGNLEQQRVADHLTGCRQCRVQLEQLAGSQDWWNDTREVLSQLSETIAETGPDDGTDDAKAGTSIPQSLPDPSDGRLPQEQHWVLALLQKPTEGNAVPGEAALGELDDIPISQVVGQGGMGVVLKGRDRQLQRSLAIKLLSPMLATTGAARQRFFREAQAAAAVVHPNIVPIYAISAERSLPYLVMPYIAGGNLQQYLDAEGPLSLERVLSIGLQVAEGLSAAHLQGIVHRDIKPANLMLDEGGFRVLITDFGLARALDDATLTGSGMLAGTPQYMSPEQARGGVIDHRSDLYSLGGVLYSLATGRPPVRGDSTLEILNSIGDGSRAPVQQINERYPEWFDRLVDRLMAAHVDQRVSTADEVVQLLRSCLAHTRAPYQVSLPAGLQRGRKGVARGRWLAGASVLAISSLLLALVWGGFARFAGDSGRSAVVERDPSDAMRAVQPTDSASRPQEANEVENLSPASFDSYFDWDGKLLARDLNEIERGLSMLRAELGLPVSDTNDSSGDRFQSGY